MEVKLFWVTVKDPRRAEFWHLRWDLAGEIDPAVTSKLELDCSIDGRRMGRDWTAQAIRRAHECGCGECAECVVGAAVEATRRLQATA